jgi:flagellin FlaB
MAKLLWKAGLRRNAKGAIGIGTLIVFIALVLVAAIAASVIISTSFNLRDQAIATSEAARQEVTGPIKILNFYGDRVSTANAGLEWLVFHVTVFNGAQGINMSNMRLNYIDSQTSFIYTMQPCATAGSLITPPSGLFNATEVPVASGNGWDPASNLCFLDSGNILEIWIDVTAANPSGLLPGTETQIAFLPGSGPAVTKTFTTPTSYDSNVIVTLL